MRSYITKTMAALALIAGMSGCASIKGDTSAFSGDKSRTLEARVKIGTEGPGVFVRERLTNPNYADQSIFTNFALADAIYSFEEPKGLTAFVGSRSTARVDSDNTRNNNATGHIDPRTGVTYARKFGDFKLLIIPSTFADFSTAEHHPQFEGNITLGYQPELKDGISLDLEAENIGLFDRDKHRQNTHRLRGGLSYEGLRFGIGTDIVKAKGEETSFNNGLYIGIRF